MKTVHTLMLGVAAFSILIAGSASMANASSSSKERLENSRPSGGTKVNPTHTKRPGKFAPAPFTDLAPLAPNPVGPLPGAPNSGFCGTNQGGGVAKVVLTSVKNNGTKAGGNFHNKVIFLDAAPADRVHEDPYTDAGPGFTPAKVFFNIPASAWKNGKARFTFIVDSRKKVSETNENNNKVTSYCVEPAG